MDSVKIKKLIKANITFLIIKNIYIFTENQHCINHSFQLDLFNKLVDLVHKTILNVLLNDSLTH